MGFLSAKMCALVFCAQAAGVQDLASPFTLTIPKHRKGSSDLLLRVLLCQHHLTDVGCP